MCGLVAIYARRGEASRAALHDGMAALVHRGPDGGGAWSSPSGRVALGHRRLSIIDLSRGAQPIANEDETIHAVVNGEIYGHVELREQLQRDGHAFRTHSDSEVCLHLYERHGAGLFAHLRGEFAFVLWDERNQTLLAARDRFGIKPLYYADTGDRVVFASEVKALWAAGVPRRWSRESFHQGLCAPLNDDQTLYEGVRQVPPGHFVSLSSTGLRIVRYWDVPFLDEMSAAPRSEQEWKERLRYRLEESVRLRLAADVPVAVYLSGGLDSSAILGLAQRHASDLDAFTIQFADEGFSDAAHYDESAVAEETARRIGCRFHPVRMSPSDLVDAFEPAVVQSEVLHWNTHGAAKFLLSKAVRDAGFKVVLTGEGADETLLGYSWFQLDHTQPGPMTAQSMAKVLEVRLGLSASGQDARCNAVLERLRFVGQRLGYTPWFLAVDAWISTFMTATLRGDFADSMRDRDRLRSFLDGFDPRQLAHGPAVWRSAYLWSRSTFPNYHLNVLADRMEMANSIEGRVPFLDHVLVDELAGMPIELLFKERSEKHLLREATRDVLTDRVYQRKKFPFVAPPPAPSGKDRLWELVNDWCRSDAMDSQPFFDPVLVRTLLDGLSHNGDAARSYGIGRALSGSFGIGRVVTQIVSTCILQKAYGLSA